MDETRMDTDEKYQVRQKLIGIALVISNSTFERAERTDRGPAVTFFSPYPCSSLFNLWQEVFLHCSL
jgi:hypothetical protein